MNKSIVIIGAGIAGLSAGCYARMNSYKTSIFEIDNTRAGGLCISWIRKGYTINGCIHFLLGSRPQNGFYNIWKEFGAIQDRPMIEPNEFMRIENEQGKAFILYTDVNRLEQHMKEIAPEGQEGVCNYDSTVETPMNAIIKTVHRNYGGNIDAKNYNIPFHSLHSSNNNCLRISRLSSRTEQVVSELVW